MRKEYLNTGGTLTKYRGKAVEFLANKKSIEAVEEANPNIAVNVLA